MRILHVLAIALLSLAGYAQEPTGPRPTPLTLALLGSQRPAMVSEEQWLKLISNPANAAVLPIRLSPAMLDTLDTAALDPRYHYVLVPDQH